MDETEFRKTYREMREYPCPFEKAILNRRCGCPMNQRLNLGEREGATCSHWEAHHACTNLVDTIRRNARFALKATSIPGPLPHAKELQVQVGGISGLRDQVAPSEKGGAVTDIHAVVRQALQIYGSYEALPWPPIMAAITGFKGRPGRRRR